ncbi:MAG TPA: hypothetical protein RMH99_17750 [Sandaracinaceae bacterium LLY-WYZ-13_1]|nr:hypothetical protein [Sandaracinaceae bacterium LLY-WYZ-13_1]
MELLSTDPDRPGVFAFGQFAVGIFAFGQIATGVIAIGQVARGVVAVGQAAAGLIAVGQVSFGVFWSAGMVFVGGRGFGFGLKLLPMVRVERSERPELKPPTPWAAIRDGAEDRGWVLAELHDGRATVDGQPLPVELSPAAARGLERARAEGHTHASVRIGAETRVASDARGYREAVDHDRALVARHVVTWREALPRLRFEGPLTSIPWLLLRALGFAALPVAWWLLAGEAVYGLFD